MTSVKMNNGMVTSVDRSSRSSNLDLEARRAVERGDLYDCGGSMEEDLREVYRSIRALQVVVEVTN